MRGFTIKAMLGAMIFFGIALAALATPVDLWIQIGSQTVQLEKLPNPGAQGLIESQWMYYGYFDLEADWPEHLYGTGWGTAPFTDSQGRKIPVVLEQDTKNIGTELWDDFHIRLGGQAEVYDTFGTTTQNWDVYTGIDPDFNDINGWDYYANPGYEIGYGGIFHDGIKFWVNHTSGGSCWFTIEKWPSATVIPEPGTIAVLSLGLATAAAGVLRRRS